MNKLSIILFLFLMYCIRNSNVSGVIEDTDTGIVVYMDDGKTPAAGATVKFIPSTYAQTIVLNKISKLKNIQEVTTDKNGKFTIPELPDSTYNVIIEKESLKAMQQEVTISSGKNDIRSDTLEQTGSISAFISLQANDMDKVQSVYVQMLGTDVEFRNVDETGKFSFDDLAPGRYRLRFETNLSDYTTTFKEIRITSGVDSTLSDTIEMIYNGIDVVTNVRSEYDTAAGVITLRWDATEYSDLLDYVIYRDEGKSTVYSENIFASVSDTLFQDTIYDVTVDTGTFSVSDPLSYTYKYRIAIRNNSTSIGKTYGVTTVTAYSPSLLQPDISFILLDASVSISDTVYLRGTDENNGKIVEYAWKIGAGDWSNMLSADTFFIAPDETGELLCSLKVVDDDELVTFYDVKITVTDMAPVVNAGNDMIIGIGEEIVLHPSVSDDGRIISYEWRFGNSDWVRTSSGDTTFVAPLQEGSYQCAVRVTDEDGHSLSDAIDFTVSMFSEHVIYTSAIGVMSVFAIDVDGDEDIDVISASNKDNAIRWYENNGSQHFTANDISTSALGAKSVYAIDIDNDGDNDILSASYEDEAIRWYENIGSQQFISRDIFTSEHGANQVYAIDIDNDGDVDVVSASRGLSPMRWYENDGSQQFTTKNISASSTSTSESVYAIDIDNDGDIDILSAESRCIYLYENDGSQQFTARAITTSASFPQSLFAIDTDNDGDIDVLSAEQGIFRLYENDGLQQFTTKDSLFIPGDSYSVYAIDIDNDDDIDILFTQLSENRTIKLLENNGMHQFTPRDISTSAYGLCWVYATDMDGDGDNDVLSASMLDNTIRWYENHLENLAGQ